ncbi:hypothetical protein CHLNCDRAFT_143229 [Chlorella variabilis]|uniref:Glutaredoxin domain-containing protein n=1 Tax=Chlorella variabilis TaxID=554065 RepID=E1Z9R9_CHLVA|nr:hypothetical protein CHLNCDRAFT_143229 [Chlorella variabilis]EFN57573.1 hypothetical protein CHLNCDRAFT_143229 [Chlorella variabilis]|eukprot:XP_005849675.1 hypothetical protein CHLNCDRAFT_143229 [Chlorella variabilis]
MSAAKSLVDSTINGNKVVVFSKTYCPYCTKAKRALQQFLDASKMTVIELDARSDGSAVQDYLAQLTGGRSVPRVFIEGQFIGGGDDTEALARSGKLEVMLRNAGVLS